MEPDSTKKLEIPVKFLSEEEKENSGLLNAIKEGRTGKYTNTDDYLQKLRQNQQLS